MRLVRATKRILEARHEITPRFVELCLGLERGTISVPSGKVMVCGRKVRIPETDGTFDIHCALAGVADQYTPYLQFLPSAEAKASIDVATFITSLKKHYGRARVMRSKKTTGGWVIYHSRTWPHRSVMYCIDFDASTPSNRVFGGIMYARVHRR